MRPPSFPHLLSPSKTGQMIYRTQRKRKRQKSDPSVADVPAAPIPIYKLHQDTTLIFVELSDWVANRLKNPCGACFDLFTSRDGKRCTGLPSMVPFIYFAHGRSCLWTCLCICFQLHWSTLASRGLKVTLLRLVLNAQMVTFTTFTQKLAELSFHHFFFHSFTDPRIVDGS